MEKTRFQAGTAAGKTAGAKFKCAHCAVMLNSQPRRTFHLLRQGKTDGLNGVMLIDYPFHDLTPAGKIRAMEAARDLAVSPLGKKIRTIISSPIDSASATAEYFSSVLKTALSRDWRLVERDMTAKFYYENRNRLFLGKIMSHDYHPDGLAPMAEFEKETIDLLNAYTVDQRLGTDTLFVTNALRIATIVKIAKGWSAEMMEVWRPPGNCKIITLGIGTACKRCGWFIYEPAF